MSDMVYNARVKIYPDGTRNFTIFNRDVFNPHKVKTFQGSCASDWMREYWEIRRRLEQELDFMELRDIRKDHAKEIKEKVFDIAILNADKWTHMFTLTVSPDKLDRYDYIACGKKVCKFWQNMSHRYESEYLLIPELHRDGAIHFHGLMSAGSLPLVASGKKDNSGRPIYNIKTYHYGFTTAVPLDAGTSEHVCKYITKYITKDLVRITPRSFYYSQGLDTKVEIQYFNTDFYRDFSFVPPRDVCGDFLRVKYLREGPNL